MNLNQTTFAALCALFLIAVLTPCAMAITEDELYSILEEQNFYTPPNNELFEDEDEDGDFEFPPDNPGGRPNLVADAVYTLIIPAGRTVTFESSLTIKANPDANDAIGRIQATGATGNMVTLTNEDQNGWNGITILTDPSDDLENDWDERMEGGNFLEYCHIDGFSDETICITLGSELIDDAQVYVKSCLMDENAVNWYAFVAGNGGLYWFRNNEVAHTNGYAIECVDGMADDDPNFLENVITNNYLWDLEEWGIGISDDWDGQIRNNIIIGAFLAGIDADDPSGDAEILNNVIVGEGNIGINIATTWCGVTNNIIVDWTFGVNSDVAGTVDYCIFDDIDDEEYEGNVVEGVGCAEDTDPDFVDAGNGDYHLNWESPAINAGDPNIEDPDGSDCDIGAFCGEGASDFEMNAGDFKFYALIPGASDIEDVLGIPALEYETYRMSGNNAIDAGDELTLPAGVTILMDEDIDLTINGEVDFNGIAGNPVRFMQFVDGEFWGSIVFNPNLQSNSLDYCSFDGAEVALDFNGLDNSSEITYLNNIQISDCEGDGIDINDSYVFIDSSDPAPDVGDNTISNCGGSGIDITLVESGMVKLEYIDVLECDIGMSLDGADPKIRECRFRDSENEGMDIAGASLPDMDPGTSGRGNTVQDNGDSEIVLAVGCTPDINENNIIHLDQGVFVGFMIEATGNAADPDIDARGNYWGEDDEEQDLDDLFNEIDFATILWDPYYTEERDGAAIANFEMDRHDFLKDYWRIGNWEAVADTCLAILRDEDANSKEIYYAVHYSLPAFRNDRRNLHDLREAYFDAIELFDESSNTWTMLRYAARALVDLGDAEEAISEYADLVQTAEANEDQLNAAICEFEALCTAKAVGLEYNIDNAEEIDKRLDELRNLMRQSDNNRIVSNSSIPEDLAIQDNYPNPFNNHTRISYNLSVTGEVKLTIHDLAGREVTVLKDGVQTRGITR